MKLAVRCGIAVGLGSFLWLLAEYWLGFRTDNFGQHIQTAPFAAVVLIAGIMTAVYLNRLHEGREYRFKDGFMTGMWVSLIAGIVMFFGAYIYYGIIDTEFQARAKNWSTFVQVQGGASFQEASTNSEQGAWKHNTHVRAFSQLPLFLIEGAIISAVASAIITRKK
jgi:hypothetical protein